MADNDADNSLEKYLSDLGIDTGSETRPAAPPAPAEAPKTASVPDTHQGDGSQDSGSKNGTNKDGTNKDAADAEHRGDRASEQTSRQTIYQGVGGGSDPLAALVTGESSLERCQSFMVNLLLNLDPGYAAEVVQTGELVLHVDIVGGDPGKIIGRGGRTLAALEYLTNAVVNKDERAPHVRVSVDVGGYKVRRDERLRGVALKAASRARKTGFAVELEPMSAAERRVIHMTLADDPAIESESSGEGRDRRVVVKPL